MKKCIDNVVEVTADRTRMTTSRKSYPVLCGVSRKSEYFGLAAVSLSSPSCTLGDHISGRLSRMKSS